MSANNEIPKRFIRNTSFRATGGNKLFEMSKTRKAVGNAVRSTMPLNSLLYQIKRLLELGLLKITRVESRAGRAIKYYQAVAESFYIPYHLTPAETPEALLEQETIPRQKRLNLNLVRSAQYALDKRGETVWGIQVALEGQKLVMRNAIGPE